MTKQRICAIALRGMALFVLPLLLADCASGERLRPRQRPISP